MYIQHKEMQHAHSWLKTISVYHLPGWTDPVLEVFFKRLLETFESLGNQVLDATASNIELILASARFGEAASWRTAPLFTLRKRFQLDKLPTIVTVIHATRAEFSTVMDKLVASIRVSLNICRWRRNISVIRSLVPAKHRLRQFLRHFQSFQPCGRSTILEKSPSQSYPVKEP